MKRSLKDRAIDVTVRIVAVIGCVGFFGLLFFISNVRFCV